MTAGLRIRDLLVIVPLAAAGIGGTFAALGARGADEGFLLRQENPTRVTPAAVEGPFSRIVRATRSRVGASPSRCAVDVLTNSTTPVCR